MKLAALALLLFANLTGIALADPAQIVFIKSFPGSTPPYTFISVDQSGALLYKEAPDDQLPVKARLLASEAGDLFQFADKLNHFSAPLESGLKVAQTGKKTFRYIPAAGAPTETTFNYSTNVQAQQLLDRFEQIAETERAYLELDRTIHFDHLGINDALAQIESLWLRKQLAGPPQFVPLLTRVADHPNFMHLARERAARLRDEFTHSVPAVTPLADGAADPKPR